MLDSLNISDLTSLERPLNSLRDTTSVPADEENEASNRALVAQHERILRSLTGTQINLLGSSSNE